MEHDKQVYAETFGDRPAGFKVYHYDATGNREVVIHKSGLDYRDKTEAENAALDWLGGAGIEAEMM